MWLFNLKTQENLNAKLEITKSELIEKFNSEIESSQEEILRTTYVSEETEDYFITSDFPGSSNVMKYMKENDSQKLYRNLIKGLDSESIETVGRILSRFQIIDKGGKPKLTAAELAKFSRVKNEFCNHILKINDGCFAWRQYLLPINHFEISVFFYSNGITNLKNKEYFKDKSIVDVGGFVGDSAIIFSDYTTKSIYSFEPSSKNFELMKKTIKMNEKSNIVPVNCGLGSKKGTANIPVAMSSSLATNQTDNKNSIENSNNTETVKIETLDDYVKKNNISVGLIKVDIEGAEQDFLKGAENTIKTQKPSLLLSIYHNPSDFFNIKPMVESWNLGYKFRIVKCVDGQICAETLLIAEI